MDYIALPKIEVRRLPTTRSLRDRKRSFANLLEYNCMSRMPCVHSPYFFSQGSS